MHVSYEIRTRLDRPLLVLDNLDRARLALEGARKRLHPTRLRLVEVTRTEREIEV